ncbi:hypothetical protein FORMA_03030 [Formosa sp. Hel3_A1_48]|nr:hypothetical protein FORMA_03030 [Formosa sp. Hel3_A1_48]
MNFAATSSSFNTRWYSLQELKKTHKTNKDINFFIFQKRDAKIHFLNG